MTTPQNLNWHCALLLCAGALLDGCGASKHPAQSQVVAKVNDQEITVLQLNQTLQAAGVESATPAVMHAAIGSLVDEELLVQQALKSNLNRDPTIVQALDHERRQLLARAYAERAVYPKSPISLAEEEDYYRKHPALFENRKLYRLTAFTIQNSDMNDRLNTDLNAAHSADETRDVLDRHEIKFESQQISSAAEELPLNKLEQFATAKVGDLLVDGPQDGHTVLMSVVAIEDRPLTFEHAKPLIERYLTTVRNAEATNAYLKRVRQTAKISYAPRFADDGSQPPAPVSANGSSTTLVTDHLKSGAAELN
jgi:EpsD family peptidyl-prolyl cis-trans isomerase